MLEQPQVLSTTRPLTRHWRGRDLAEAWRQVLGDEVSHALQCDARGCRVWVLAANGPTTSAAAPALALPPLAAGQSAILRGMILTLGVAGYQETRAARSLIEAGQVEPVAEAPVLTQPIFAAIHARNRHRAVWRKLIAALRATLGETA